MKFLFGCLLSVLLMGAYNLSYAQSELLSVTGKVFTENHSPAVGATVILFKAADSSVVRSAIIDNSGKFELNTIKPGKYFISVHKIGYNKFYSAPYFLTAGKKVELGEITLIQLNRELNEVTIKSHKEFIEVQPDKTVLNVDRSILASGNSMYEVLQTAPGVRVTDNGILYRSGQKALIAINGKPVGNLTDEQLADLLKSYPASMISQVELIANPSAKYDAAGGGGVINLILKKSKDVGFRASIVESAAYGQDYKLNTGINLNYTTPKFSFFGSYNFADNKTPRELDIDRKIDNGSLLTDIDVDYNSTIHIKTNNFNGGVDYKVTPKQTIGALIYGYSSRAGIDKNSTTYIRNNGSLDSILTTRSHVDRDITNLNYNLNYKGSFGARDQTSLSADFDYSTYNRSSLEIIQNDFYLTSGLPYRDPFFYLDNSPSSINVRSERIDFSQQLTKGSSLSLGLKNNQVNSDNTIDFEQREDTVQNFMPVPALTDKFVYNERVNEGYVSYNDRFGNSDLTLGLRAEQTNSYGISYHPDKTVTRSYFDLFPNLELIQTINENNQVSLGYNRRIERPNYQDLNPFVAYVGEYSYNTGNPFLKPEYYNTYHISDLYKSKYKFELNLTITKDLFTLVYHQNDSSKIYTSTTENIGTWYEYQADFTVPVTITKWWDANIFLETSYEYYVYNLDSARKASYDIILRITQDFTITKGLRAELFGTYESPTYYGIKQYKQQYSVRAGLSQSVLHDNGTIRFSVSDIFNTDRYRYTSNYENINLTGMEKPGTRFATLTFTYRFGKQSVKGPRKRIGGNTDDQKRLGGSSNEN